MKGKAYLVGAGPGDPELLTLKALKILQSADVVLHDDLISAEILALAPRTAFIQNVGKRCGQKRITQDEINSQLVSLASSGLQVVRLKGGDPFIFGRGGEEIEALRQHGIGFEIVPGVTAALGAAAGIRLPRRHSGDLHAGSRLRGHGSPPVRCRDEGKHSMRAHLARDLASSAGLSHNRGGIALGSSASRTHTPCRRRSDRARPLRFAKT